ncbi:hypothetical protein HMPREF1979_00298 [Actinomyces johnsonii F0542]|uniref:Uncharacterized protein n=1 Tax=Actinomyces johnsonii F0542 TaxID=1321818 RepID=U1QUM6_9ACTO|nr:hypothetical protein HMPREF1979_00298 [Actinomyces johnsonii F0542]
MRQHRGRAFCSHPFRRDPGNDDTGWWSMRRRRAESAAEQK